MFEALATQRDKRRMELDAELGVHGLSLYGLAMAMNQVSVPQQMAVPTVLTLFAVVVFRWLDRRWALEDLDAAR